MPLGTATGACRLPTGAAYPVPPPPGVVVVTADDAEAVAADIARSLGVSACLSPGDAATALLRRRSAVLERPRARLEECRVAAAVARAAGGAVGGAVGGATPPGPRLLPGGLTPAAVRSAARRVADAAENLRAERDALGTRPAYDPETAADARAAQAGVEEARRDRAAALARANSTLVWANAGAAALVVGRVASEAFDRAFVLVALLPLAALVHTAHAVIVPAQRARAAARRRWAALRSMEVSTLSGLAALEDRAGAWQRRYAGVTAAEAELRRAGDAWRSLVGDTVAVASSERLAGDLEAAAALRGAARAADRAWAEAAAALQAAEDTAGAGQPPMVVLHAGPAGDDVTRRYTLARLAALAGSATVVVVAAGPEAVGPAGAGPELPERSPDPEVPDIDLRDAAPPGAGRGAPAGAPRQVPVRRPAPAHARPRQAAASPDTPDLRRRVKAGLLRLRALAAAPRERPGSPVRQTTR